MDCGMMIELMNDPMTQGNTIFWHAKNRCMTRKSNVHGTLQIKICIHWLESNDTVGSCPNNEYIVSILVIKIMIGINKTMIQMTKPRIASIPTLSYSRNENARGCNVSMADNVPMIRDIQVILPDKDARLKDAISFVSKCRPMYDAVMGNMIKVQNWTTMVGMAIWSSWLNSLWMLKVNVDRDDDDDDDDDDGIEWDVDGNDS